ncbi:MAG: hypothetical protein GY922_08205 [Proteobacteria bacterium]|nr:hypothetical protein [Pseudomonadota bacterium]
MSRSKRTQKQIENKEADKYDYIGDKEVADKLQEIEFPASTLETIDTAMLRFIDETLNLSVETNNGFEKVPVLWVTAERAYQIKHNKDLRDKEETLILPLITVNRASVTKEPNFKGSVYANLYPENDAKGGVITIARQINQKKTAEFQNAQANRMLGVSKDVANKMKNTNKRNMSAAKTVYETITIPIPVWVKVMYEITVRSEYQQQLNQLVTPFLTVPGNSRTPKRIENEGHFYEIFIDGNLSDTSNKAALGMEQRNYETTISIETLGYLIGDGDNQEKPKIVKRENAVEFKIARERTIFGDIPDTIKDGFYRE